MIAIISKKELEKIVVNAIEVYNKKKEINKEEKYVNYDEYIFDLFNEYLSKNKNLYENILPKKIKELFQIKEDEGIISNIIKNEINSNNLFNSMQFHNKIYVYNINIENEIMPDFNTLKPLNNEQFKYLISPYISEKWKFKASNDNEINNTNILKNVIGFDLIGINTNNETKLYKRYKISEKFEEFQKFNLFYIILSNITQNDMNLALKNCEYFIEKYKTSISFLHSLIYLCLSFIYNTISNSELSEKYYEKCLLYLKWLFPREKNFLFLILLNNEENIILKNIDNIVNIFDNCVKMWKKYYKKEFNNNNGNCELNLDEIIFRIYFKINSEEKNDEKFVNDLYYNNIRPLIKEFDGKLNKRKNMMNVYIKLFFEFFKNCPGCHINILNDLIRCSGSFN